LKEEAVYEMVDVTVPKLGSVMTEATVTRWLKSVGDQVAEGEALAEIETEKTNHTIESPARGTIRRILVEAGTTVPIAAVLAQIESS
jgi:pyruvate/2-oxoglutarate dehydrogenase complex dihydrolipoamide acyltransferase (E2) component